LGLTLRKVVVFFSNHRVRGFGKKYSTGKSSVCSSNPSSLKQETTEDAATTVDPASYLKQELEEKPISVSNPSYLKQEIDEEVATEAPIAASPE
jgi:hypothetical protein